MKQPFIKIACFILLLLVSSAIGKAQSDWKKDLTFLKEELPQKHKNLFFQMDRQTFEQEVDALASKVTYNFSDYVNGIDPAMNAILKSGK